MNILITGGSGMLGKALVRNFSRKNKILAVSKSGRDKTIVCDLTKPKAVENFFEGKSPDLVVHSAAYSDVDGCESHPALAHASNALATKYLAEACGARRVPFVYISTDYVFDGKGKVPYRENDVTFPINIYGITKLEGEHYARERAAVSAIVRTSWLFGPENPDTFVNAIAMRLRKEKAVSVLNDQEDSPTYVEDLAKAVESIADRLVFFSRENPGRVLHDVFQYCNSGSCTRYEMAAKMRECLGLKEVDLRRMDKKEIKNRVALRPSYSVMSTEHFQKTFKQKIRTWQASLGEYLGECFLCGS